MTLGQTNRMFQWMWTLLRCRSRSSSIHGNSCLSNKHFSSLSVHTALWLSAPFKLRSWHRCHQRFSSLQLFCNWFHLIRRRKEFAQNTLEDPHNIISSPCVKSQEHSHCSSALWTGKRQKRELRFNFKLKARIRRKFHGNSLKRLRLV